MSDAVTLKNKFIKLGIVSGVLTTSSFVSGFLLYRNRSNNNLKLIFGASLGLGLFFSILKNSTRKELMSAWNVKDRVGFERRFQEEFKN